MFDKDTQPLKGGRESRRHLFSSSYFCLQGPTTIMVHKMLISESTIAHFVLGVTMVMWTPKCQQ